MASEYIIYADESVERGRYFSNFYGGCLVESHDLQAVTATLEARKRALNLHREVKWQKVTGNYLAKYQDLMGGFFELVGAGKVKVRVMFTHNRNLPTGLSANQREDAYFLLYYQFIKHAFGLRYASHALPSVGVRLLLDSLPESYEKRARFRAYVAALSSSAEFRRARIEIKEGQIAEVDSHDHVLLQCIDIVLGAMQFRLNDKHECKPPGQLRRGSRTIAKHALYRSILAHVRRLHPGFNPGISTGTGGNFANRWLDPYRHWVFIPRRHQTDETASKRRQ